MTYTYLNPKVALMGAGCVKEIGKHAKVLGATKALIVSGKSKHGENLAQDILQFLKKIVWKVQSFREQNQILQILQLWKELISTEKKTAI